MVRRNSCTAQVMVRRTHARRRVHSVAGIRSRNQASRRKRMTRFSVGYGATNGHTVSVLGHGEPMSARKRKRAP